MQRLLPLLAAFAVATPLSAQLTSGLTTKGEFGVVANKLKDSLPDQTAIVNSKYLTAMDGVGLEGRKAYSTSLAAHWTNTLAGTRMASVTDSAWAQPGNRGETISPHELVWKLGASTATTGTLKLTYIGRVGGNGKAEAKVDVGNVNFTAPADGKAWFKDIPGLEVGSAGLEIRIRTLAQADASSATVVAEAFGNLSMTFVPDQPATTCTIKLDKTSCKEGGTLNGASKLEGNAHLIDFGLAAASAKAFAVSLISAKADTASFGAGCVLFTQPVWVGVSLTDDKGATSLRLAVPATTPLTGWVQMATVKIDTHGISLATSNTLVVDCH
ncbi:MAG: hypothetical protein R3F30_04075 [Planctomycetota bacterium]